MMASYAEKVATVSSSSRMITEELLRATLLLPPDAHAERKMGKATSERRRKRRMGDSRFRYLIHTVGREGACQGAPIAGGSPPPQDWLRGILGRRP